MINVKIHSNDEKLMEFEWPNIMACRPMSGDKISSICGNHCRAILSITHKVGVKFIPFLEIEI